MASWINITPKFQQGLEIVSKLDMGKFRLLVQHICQGLAMGNGKIFSDEEETKLMASLSLEEDDLRLLIDTITFIYTQAAFFFVKPETMESTMKESFSISEENVSIFLNAWILHGKEIIDTLRKKTIFPNEVEDITWSYGIQSASPAGAFDNKQVALLQLKMASDERLTVEMDKSHLTELYQHLEKIQEQLDALK